MCDEYEISNTDKEEQQHINNTVKSIYFNSTNSQY
jgi:hypothetical protein